MHEREGCDLIRCLLIRSLGGGMVCEKTLLQNRQRLKVLPICGPFHQTLLQESVMNSSGTESPAGKERAEPAPSTPEKPTTSLPSSYVADNQKVDDSSKLKALLSILRR